MLSFSLPRVAAVRHIRAHTLCLQFSAGRSRPLEKPVLFSLSSGRPFPRLSPAMPQRSIKSDNNWGEL